MSLPQIDGECNAYYPLHWYGTFGYGILVRCHLPANHDGKHCAFVDEEFKRIYPDGLFHWNYDDAVEMDKHYARMYSQANYTENNEDDDE